MPPAPPLAITGSTGALGGLVARDLASRGLQLRLLARTPQRAPQLEGAVAVHADYAAGASAAEALDGVETLFMVSGSEAADRLAQHRTFVDAAARAGVGHIVYTSFAGAAPDCTFTLGRDHHGTEAHIRASGMGWTFLRDNLYLDFMADLVGPDDVIRGPAGDGRVAAVARADIARAAVAALLDPDAHRDMTYTLTGPEALTLTDVAQILSAHTGRTIRFSDETVDEAYTSRRHHGVPHWQLDAWVSTYTAIAAGELESVTGHVRQLTGQDPISLRQLLGAAEG